MWHRGRCPPYGEGVTFWALGEMVRMRAGIAESEDAGVLVAKLARDGRRARPRRGRAPLDRASPGPPARPRRPAGGDRDELFAAWRTFFERWLTTAPVGARVRGPPVGRHGLRDFLESLLDWCAARPIFVLTLARPEPLDRRPGWGTGGGLPPALDPLPPAAMRELLDGFVAGLPDDASPDNPRTSRGVPVYAVETVRMLVARPARRSEGDASAATASSTRSTSRRPSTLWSRPTRRPSAAAERSSRTPQSSGRASRLQALAGGRPASRPDELEPAPRGRSFARRCWRCRPIRASPGAGPVRASSRISSGVSPTRHWSQQRAAQRGTSRPPRTSRQA